MSKSKYCTDKVAMMLKKVKKKLDEYEAFTDKHFGHRDTSSFDALSDEEKDRMIRDMEAKAGITDAALVNAMEEKRKSKITLGSAKRARVASSHRTFG